MKYCEKCENQFETEACICQICKTRLIDIPDDEINEYEAAEIVSTMMMTGIL